MDPHQNQFPCFFQTRPVWFGTSPVARKETAHYITNKDSATTWTLGQHVQKLYQLIVFKINSGFSAAITSIAVILDLVVWYMGKDLDLYGEEEEQQLQLQQTQRKRIHRKAWLYIGQAIKNWYFVFLRMNIWTWMSAVEKKWLFLEDLRLNRRITWSVHLIILLLLINNAQYNITIGLVQKSRLCYLT